MAVINPPAWMQAGSYPARTDRLVVSALLGYPGFLVDESTPMRVRQGVKPSYQNQQLKVRAAATPNMTVIVSAGFCVIDQHETGGTGTYVCANDADVTLTIQPAGGAGQYRRDTVVASVYDAEYSGAASEWRLEVIQGAYAASAGATVRPTLPPNAQLLADIAISPSQTSITAANISDFRQFTTGLGGILPVASSGAPPRPHPGQMQYLYDTDRFQYGKADGTVAPLFPAWQSWVPTWASSGAVQPSLGNATVTCKYVRFGTTIHMTGEITFGSSTNFGSTGNANWFFGLPVAAANTVASLGYAGLRTNNAAKSTSGFLRTNNASTFYIYVAGQMNDDSATSGGIVDRDAPSDWAAGDRISWFGTYEAAA